jgi:hypothetical protein
MMPEMLARNVKIDQNNIIPEHGGFKNYSVLFKDLSSRSE